MYCDRLVRCGAGGLFGEPQLHHREHAYVGPPMSPLAATMQSTQLRPTVFGVHVGFDLGAARLHVGQVHALMGDEMRLKVFAKPPCANQFVAAGPGAVWRQREPVVVDAPNAEGKKALMTRGPRELLPLTKVKNFGAKYHGAA